LEIPPLDYKKIQQQLFALEAAFRFTKENYQATYPRLNLFRDARIIVFSKCINVINSTFFAFNALEKASSNGEWWNKMKSDFGAIQPNARFHRTTAMIQYDTFVRIAFSTQLFASIDGSFRDFLRVLMPNLRPEKMIDFTAVSHKLLATLCIGEDYLQLLDLYRLTRNTLHNGFYLNPWSPDKGTTLTYKNRDYPFIPYEPVDFSNWEFLLMLGRDIRWLLFELVNHKDLIAKREITDSVGVKLEPIYRRLFSNNRN
jgi:hypothetical protein